MTSSFAVPSSSSPALGRRLRVLHFVSGGFSGATQVAIDLCGDDAQQETLLILRRRMMDPSERVLALRTKGLRVEVIPRFSYAAIWRLRAICQRWRPDVLVAHGFSEHLWGRYAGLWAGVPRVFQVEHNIHERYTRWRLRQSLWLAQRTQGIICVSQAVRDAVVAKGHPADKCSVVHNGIELSRWRKGLPWDERENAIVMPARFASQKDHATLIQAAALLASRGLRPKVYLAGEGKSSWRTAAQSLARRLGVAEQVVFLGHVQDLPELVGRVRLCVLSTHYEGLGLGLIEGMASGCCGVGSDVEGVNEIIEHGRNGMLVPRKDPQALADTLARLLTDTQAAFRLAQAGQEDAHARFDRARMVQQYRDIFLDQPAPTAR